MGALVQVKDLVKTYTTPSGPVEVLKGIDLEIQGGEMVAIMGPSGCGKSTFMYILGLLQGADSGLYRLMDKNLLGLSESEQSKMRRQLLGYVLQTCNLFEHSTVYENIEYPLMYSGVKRNARDPLIKTALEQVQMEHRSKHPSNRLSGGEQQRVAIARALVNQPRLILADEPTGQLDQKNGQIVMDTFRQILQSKERAIIIVTHDAKVASLCDHVYNLSDGLLEKTAY